MNNLAEKNTRPAGIMLIMVGFAGIVLFQINKLIQTLAYWETLTTLNLSISPLFLVSESLAWVVVGGLLIWGIWQAKDWALPVSLAACLVFAIFHWIKLVWIYEPSVLKTRWPVNLTFTILGLGIFSTILSLKSSRGYFRENKSKIT